MELLSPAGSFDALRAAVSAGCDAVYLGSSEFANARMNAANFDKAELSDAIDYCKLRGVKTYITVNTLLTDREIGQLFDYGVFLYENGADGVIVQDIGVMKFLSDNIPKLPLHASTQMGICNLDGVRFAERIGCTRAVVARELSKENIDYICKNSNIEIEVFVHGAVCSCCSGFCLMSSFIGRRSGNRGKCAQPCRMQYRVGDKEGAFMSLKDMMLVNHIKELEASGVASLKIEGRMKGAGYVGTVTEIYRKAIDNGAVSENDIKRLRGVFDRGGYTDSYYIGGKDLFVKNRKDTEYGDREYAAPEKKVGADIFVSAKIGQPISIKFQANGRSFEAKGDFVCEKALKREVTAEDIKSKVLMLGDTPFICDNFYADVESNLMVPVSEIKSVRRNAAEGLGRLLLEKRKLAKAPKINAYTPFINKGGFKLSAFVSTVSQYRASEKADMVYVPISLLVKNIDVFSDFDNRIIAVLPKINHDSKRDLLKSMISTAEKMGYNKLSAANFGDFEFSDFSDYTLWCFNSETASAFYDMGKRRICLSPELNISQIKGLKSPVPCEAVVYGKLPLMTSVNCFAENAGACGSCNISDRTGRSFDLLCDKELGVFEVLNSVPIYMADKISDFENTCVDTLRLVFTDEDENECRRIIKAYRCGEKPSGEFTRGHYYRGV